ncbi:MAG: helix-turn-helix transcriptional regulator [Pseudomonadota bacterium]
MTNDIRSPAELRAMFGSNLRELAQDYRSVSALCRQLGINRTQFNRYLGGESFPRADVLDRICRFFDVDARIVLKPLNDIQTVAHHPASSALTQFLASGSEAAVPSPFAPGFYTMTVNPKTNPQGLLLFATRLPQCTLVRGYMPRHLTSATCPKTREIQGIATCSGTHVMLLTSQRNGHNSRVYVVAPNAGHWAGTLVTPAKPHDPKPVEMVHLGHDMSTVLAAARSMVAPGGASPRPRLHVSAPA